MATPPASVDGFTDAVLAAEGLDLTTVDKRLRAEVRAMVEKAFEANGR